MICLFVSFEVRSVSTTKHQWTFHGKNGDIEFYVDYKNVETRNGFVYWYYLGNQPKNKPLYGKSTITYKKGDCGDMKFMTLTNFVYDKLNGKGVMMRKFQPPERKRGWEFVVPGSNGEYELKKVCNVSSKKD